MREIFFQVIPQYYLTYYSLCNYSYWGQPRLQNNYITIIIIFKLRTSAFKAYCAIWVRRSNFRHQASPRVSPRKSTQRRKVELWARNVRKFCLNAHLHVTFREHFTCRKATTWDRRLYFPSERRRAEDFFFQKIRRLRPGANPRNWEPKASTLHLDHRSLYITVIVHNWEKKTEIVVARYSLIHECTDPRLQIAMATTFCTMASNIWWSSVDSLIQFKFLSPRISRLLLDIRKCMPPC
jgi:hypothetical protein